MIRPLKSLGGPFPDRKPLRLWNFDYRSSNAYFITITTRHRRTVLARESAEQVVLTPIGRVVSDRWLSIATRFPSVGLDEFVLMPDHFHAIVFLDVASGMVPVGAGLARPDRQAGNKPSLGRVIGSFKSLTTIAVNRMAKTPGTRLWQRGYYDRVIRNEAELTGVREYIKNNPDALLFSRLWK